MNKINLRLIVKRRLLVSLIIFSVVIINAQSYEKLNVSFSKEKKGEEIEVKITFQNNSENEIFMSCDYSYGG